MKSLLAGLLCMALIGGCSYSDGDRVGYSKSCPGRGGSVRRTKGSWPCRPSLAWPRPSGTLACGTMTSRRNWMGRWENESCSIIGSYAMSPRRVLEKRTTSWIAPKSSSDLEPFLLEQHSRTLPVSSLWCRTALGPIVASKVQKSLFLHTAK